MNMKTLKTRQARAGVTLTELLVVLVIISILSSIALPVYINDAERAREATAQLETKTIADSMEKVGTLYGFYIPIQLLDNLPGGALVPGVDPQSDDAIGDESNIALIDFNRTLLELDNNQLLLNDQTNSRVDNLVQNWEGPFMSFQRTAHNENDTNAALARFDHPLDPWGRPYRFFSPLGPIGSGWLSDDPDQWRTSSFSDGIVVNGGTFDFYDRYAIVSFGADGEPNEIGNRFNDDIFYVFGTIRAETAFTNPNP